MEPFSEHIEVEPYMTDCFCDEDRRAECSCCKGTGQYETTSNPKRQWTWYRIGGRWDGILFDKENLLSRETENGFNFNGDHESFKQNRRVVGDVDWEGEWVLPYAIVTPDGEWHSKGKMYMFGMSDNKMTKEEWRKHALEVLNQYKDHFAIVLDCHQ